MIAVTGASGFVGQALCSSLLAQGRAVRPLLRAAAPTTAHAVTVADIGPDTDWSTALSGVSAVVHCAARVHVMQDSAGDPMAAFRRVNVAGTRRLAQQAAALGVRRLVYLSSLKVHGEHTPPGTRFSVQDAPHPLDAYGLSKWEAEQALWDVARDTGLEVVVVRPPLVYGRGVKANFLSLMRLVARGVPLPLGLVDNRRSLLALDNLTDLLTRCLDQPEAAGQTFLASDNHDLSTAELIRLLAAAMGRPTRLLPVPVAWLHTAGRLTGRQGQIERLTGSLQVDIGHTTKVLDWTPRLTVEQGLRMAVQDVVK